VELHLGAPIASIARGNEGASHLFRGWAPTLTGSASRLGGAQFLVSEMQELLTVSIIQAAVEARQPDRSAHSYVASFEH